jgi:hypothetical protein
MDNREIRVLNLKRLKQEAKLNYLELAAKIHSNPSYLSQCMSDTFPVSQRKRRIGDDLARRIEHAFGKAVGWLDQPPNNLFHQEGVIPCYPLLSIGSVKEWLRNPILSSSHAVIKMIALEGIEISPNAFTIPIRGDAMVDKNNYQKSIGSGDIALFDPAPAVPMAYGDIVCVEVACGDERIREYRQDGARETLHAYDTSVEIMDLTDEMHILGVLIDVYRPLRRRR